MMLEVKERPAQGATWNGPNTKEIRPQSNNKSVTVRQATIADFFDSLPLPSGRVLHWLLDQGVPFDALHSVKSAWVQFEGTGFDLDPTMAGDPVMVFRCKDRGETVDLAAWSARDNRLATWRMRHLPLAMLTNASTPRLGLMVAAFISMRRHSIGYAPMATAS